MKRRDRLEIFRAQLRATRQTGLTVALQITTYVCLAWITVVIWQLHVR